MSGSTVNTIVSGNNVIISVRISAADALFGWWVRVTSKYDYGYGKGQGVGDYPWIVEIIDHTSVFDTSYDATKTYKPGLYVAELNLMHTGPVDYSLFELGTAAPPTTAPTLASITIPTTATVAVGKAATLITGCKNTSGGVMTCPLLTWGFGTGGYVTISSGVITGVSPGTVLVNAWDTVTGIASNICTVTVTGTVVPAGIPKATVFNWCWKVGMATGACAMPRDAGAVTPGSAVVIQADVVNSGYAGKVRCVIKIDGSQILSQDNPSLDTFPSGPLWSVRTTYTMPNKNVTLAAETYSWDGSTWALTDSKTDIISTSAPACSTISLDPASALVDPKDTKTYQVTMTATVTPLGFVFPVMFKSGSGTILGTCNSDKTTGKCTFIWDYNSLKSSSPDTTYSDGTSGYYVTAAVGTAGTVSSCYSTQSTIVVGKLIKQWTVNVIVHDSSTGGAISGATVAVGTVGGPTNSKDTDATGTASFIVDEGTVGIAINKTGYNNFTTAEYVFMNKTFTYSFVKTPVIPTTGSVQFVSVPSGAAIYLDSSTTSAGVTPKTVDGISAGTHNFTLKLAGYNDSLGTVVVQSGSTAYAYASMTVLTPTKGALNITSHPVMGAEVYIDGTDYKVTTSGATLITDIPPGSHQYTLKMTGYKDSTGTFGVNAGLTTFIDAEMVPLLTIGSVEITSTPSGAKVYVDGNDTSKATGASIMNLDIGSHTYKLVLSGYQDGAGTFDIKAGAVTSVDVILKAVTPTTGTLIIKSDPPNAQVIIDGEDTGKVTPAIVKDLTAESHTYLLKLVGYKDVGAIVSITAGFTKTVNVNLEQIAGPPPVTGGMGIGEVLAAGAAAVVIVSYLASKDK
jgi:hypothetical protein